MYDVKLSSNEYALVLMALLDRVDFCLRQYIGDRDGYWEAAYKEALQLYENIVNQIRA